MSVLTLAGKSINWAKPPKPTDMVVWSKRDKYGRVVKGSLRTIAHLDHLNNLAKKKYGVEIEVFQGPYNTTVAASEGTHDFDACIDAWIPGVDGMEQQRFFRANGAGAYLRTPAQGFTLHIHYFTLPPREGASVSDDYAVAGFRVGRYVDGGYSTYGTRVASAQIEDYYQHKTALAGHLHDPSWFPENITASIFDLDAYIERQRKMTAPRVTTPSITVLTANVEDMEHPPLVAVLSTTKANLAVLQQASRLVKLAKGSGYRRFGYKTGIEARGIKSLVSRNLKVGLTRRLRMTMPWVGPKTGKRHEPRVYQALQVLAPFRFWVVNVHFPTGGPDGPNAKAWAESWRRLVQFLSKRRGVAIGDFNATAAQLKPLCETAGFDLTSLGKVDHAVSHRLRRAGVQRDIPGTPDGVHGWGAVTYEPIRSTK